MANIYGIDISKYQGTINWPKVKAAGKDFAFIRLGWCGYDGSIIANGGLDSMYHANMQQAIAAGLNVGVYVYSYAKTAAAARVAARETLDLVKQYQLTYPIAFDIEDKMNTSMSKSENTAITKSFLMEIEQSGYYGIIYTFKSFAEANMNMSELSMYDMWIAQWASQCTYSGNYGIWQYVGDAGKCDGVLTACDLNISYRDYADIIKTAGLNGFKKIEITLPEKPLDNTEIVSLRSENAALKNKILRIKEILEV